MVAFHAVSSLGGVNTTINPLYTVDELTRQLNDAGARYLITIPEFVDKAITAASASAVEEVFVFGEAPGATPFFALLEGEEYVPEVDIDPRKDLVTLPYSSGTTGVSKGVMLTHHNLVANVCQYKGMVQVTGKTTLIAVIPFSHIYGQLVLMNYNLAGGATTVTLPRFDFQQFLSALQDYRVTMAHLVPPIVLALAKQPIVESYDLSNLETILCGAAPLGKELANQCSERLGCEVVQGYGLTETSPVTHLSPVGERNQPDSVGPCLPNTEARIVDPETSADLGIGEQGEIWVRGPQVMKGYFNQSEATAAVIDDDGWLHTGDISFADDDAWFYVVDRVKELIKYKAYQVAPAELEAILMSHPEIVDAAVVGVPDEECGELPKAFIVKNGSIEADEIVDYVAQRVSPQKRIHLVEFVDEIPKAPSGKILRRLLRDKL